MCLVLYKFSPWSHVFGIWLISIKLLQYIDYMKFWLLISVSIKITAFWGITPCNVVHPICCLHLQGRRVRKRGATSTWKMEATDSPEAWYLSSYMAYKLKFMLIWSLQGWHGFNDISVSMSHSCNLALISGGECLQDSINWNTY
jgi:hypothetical protein